MKLFAFHLSREAQYAAGALLICASNFADCKRIIAEEQAYEGLWRTDGFGEWSDITLVEKDEPDPEGEWVNKWHQFVLVNEFLLWPMQYIGDRGVVLYEYHDG
jgi:hypothetical protein